MNMFKQIMAAGLAFFAISMGANAQVIGGEVNIDGSRDDVTFFGGELDIRGDIDGDIFAVAGDGRINAVVHGDVSFFGGDIDLAGVVDGSVEIAGGDVNVDARIGDDLEAAGGDITVEGTVGGDLGAAGGSARIDAVVQGDLHAGGGDVVVVAASEVFGDARIVAGQLEFSGTLHGDADIEGSDVTLAGVFNGNVEVRAEHVVVTPGARIAGLLTVRSPVEPEIGEGAMIGELDYAYEMFNFGAKHWDDVDIDIDGPWEIIGAPFRFLGGAFFGSAFLLGLLAAMIAPRGVNAVTAAFRERPLSAGVLGLVSLALSPVLLVMLIVLLAITVVGVFLVPILVLLYLPALFLAFVFGGLAVGDAIFNRAGKGLGLGMRALSLLLVLAVVFALGAVPGLGTTAGVILLCIGLGAWIMALGNRKQAAAAPQLAQDDNTASEG